MKNVFVYILLLSLIAVAYAAVSVGDFGDPKHPGKCVVYSKVYEPGTHTDHDSCTRIICNKNGYGEIQTCGVELVQPGCKIGKALRPEAEYPDCCQNEIICA